MLRLCFCNLQYIRFGTLKSDSTHHFFGYACTKSGSLRFSQFSGCWLILSVYILMSFDWLWKIVWSSVILLLPLIIYRSGHCDQYYVVQKCTCIAAFRHVQSVPITSKVVSSILTHDKVNLIQLWDRVCKWFM